tara:strand:+ start:262 stop:474 length:213 start_codon:yes stop_codon:yes gene_type:complete
MPCSNILLNTYTIFGNYALKDSEECMEESRGYEASDIREAFEKATEDGLVEFFYGFNPPHRPKERIVWTV